MTCGVVVPVDGELMEDTLFGNMALPHHAQLKPIADDPRFAAAIYRSALNGGIMDASSSESPPRASPDEVNGESQVKRAQRMHSRSQILKLTKNRSKRPP
jgi:hypothetical protein